MLCTSCRNNIAVWTLVTVIMLTIPSRLEGFHRVFELSNHINNQSVTVLYLSFLTLCWYKEWNNVQLK